MEENKNVEKELQEALDFGKIWINLKSPIGGFFVAKKRELLHSHKF